MRSTHLGKQRRLKAESRYALIYYSRLGALAATFGLLTSANLTVFSGSIIVYLGRYISATLLLLLTGHLVRADARILSEAAVPSLVRYSWWTFAFAAIMLPLSVNIAISSVQLFTFGLLLANVHFNAKFWSADVARMVTDFQIIFWILSLTVVASLISGVEKGGRLAGIYSNANSLAIVSAIVLVLGVGGLARGTSVLVSTIVLISAISLVLTETRSALLGAVAAIFYVVLKKWDGRINPWMVFAGIGLSAVACIGLLLSFKFEVPDVIQRFARNDDGELLSGRDSIWESSLSLWSTRPITGFGFRTGEFVFESHYSVSAGIAHNSYLQTLLEVGALGALPFLVLLILIVRALKNTRSFQPLISAQALTVLLLVVAFSESILFGVGQVMSWTFWFSIGALSIAERSLQAETKPL